MCMWALGTDGGVDRGRPDGGGAPGPRSEWRGVPEWLPVAAVACHWWGLRRVSHSAAWLGTLRACSQESCDGEGKG